MAVMSTFAFLVKHSIPNTPCLIKNATAGWKAAKDWVRNGEINTKALKEMFGEVTQVASIGVHLAKPFL